MPLSPGPRHRHDGWAKSTVFEQFGVTATEVYSFLTYYQATTGNVRMIADFREEGHHTPR